MNIFTYREQFERLMLPSSGKPPSVEGAWAYFKDSIRANLEEEYIEELAFSAGYGIAFDSNNTVQYNKGIFEIGFRRLIDSVRPKSYSWDVAEIGFYFSYNMNDELLSIAEETQMFNAECFYSKCDCQKSINAKLEAFFAIADDKAFIWEAVTQLEPADIDLHFWLQ